jgi:hypothetical protein
MHISQSLSGQHPKRTQKGDRYYFMRFYDDQIKIEIESRGDGIAQSMGVIK